MSSGNSYSECHCPVAKYHLAAQWDCNPKPRAGEQSGELAMESPVAFREGEDSDEAPCLSHSEFPCAPLLYFVQLLAVVFSRSSWELDHLPLGGTGMHSRWSMNGGGTLTFNQKTSF